MQLDNEDLSMEVRIRQIALNRYGSAAGLARAIGCCRTTAWRFTTGQRLLPAPHLIKLLEELGLDAALQQLDETNEAELAELVPGENRESDNQ